MRPAVRKTRWNAPTEAAVVPKVPKKKVSWDKTSAVKKAKNHRIVQKFRAEPGKIINVLRNNSKFKMNLNPYYLL